MMSKVSGLILVLSGAAVASYVTPWYVNGTEPAVAEQVVVTSSIAPVAQRSATPAADEAPAAKAATPVRVAAAPENKRTDAAPAAAIPKAAPPPRPAVPTTGSSPPPAAGGAVNLAQAQRAPEPVARPVPSVTPFKTTLIPNDPVALARELQKELKRVGCYDGEVNGVWTPNTKKSMKAFTERVNASLPIEKPDYILLSLVQSHADKACGKACPTGQGMAEDGRCLPNAILAQAQKKSAPVAPPPAPKVLNSPPPPAPPAPPPARTVIAAPAPAVTAPPPVPPRAAPVVVPNDRPLPPASGWTATTRPAAPTPPSAPAPAPSATPAPPALSIVAAAPPAAAPDGRMGLAGPPSNATLPPGAATPTPPGAAPTAGAIEPPHPPPVNAGERKYVRNPSPPPPRAADRSWARNVFKRTDNLF
jgi:hypothetical protein